MDRLLTIDEVSSLLGLSRKTIYGYTSSKQIPYLKIGNSVRFKESDIEKWAESKRVDIVGGRP